MKTRAESSVVLYPAEEPVAVTTHDIDRLKDAALGSPAHRARLCTHQSPADSLHEMLIVLTHDTYVRPHRHHGKSESFTLLEGSADLVLFQENGDIQRIIPMGPPGTGKVFYHRLAGPVYHTVLVRSDLVVVYEVTEGPFRREQTEFPGWAPEERDAAGIAEFQDRLAAAMPPPCQPPETLVTMPYCKLCTRAPLTPLLDFGRHPIAQHFLRDRTATEYTHPVEVCRCDHCGLIQLVNDVPPDKFYTDYVTLSSWKTHPHVPDLVALLRRLTGLNPETRIVEIGSNDGSFLKVLREQGCQHVVGIEPARDARAAAQAQGIATFGEFLSPATADQFVRQHGVADLVVSRHVVEHITALEPFGEALRKLCRPGTHVLIEIPYFDFCLEARDYSGIWEQHSNYFTRATLTLFLDRCGIELLHHQTFGFSGMAQVAIGRYTGKSCQPALAEDVRIDLRRRAEKYRDDFPIFKVALHSELAEARGKYGRLALYGAGSRTCCLVNFLGLAEHFAFVADDQPEKQNLFLPGSRLPILPGTALDDSDIGLCLLGVNAEMESKVIARRRRFTERGGVFRSVHPPSPLLLDAWKAPLGAATLAAV